MIIISFFTICIFLAIAGKNLEIISYKYPRDVCSCTPWLQREYWHDIGHSLYDNNFKVYDGHYKLLVRYDAATEKMRKLGYE